MTRIFFGYLLNLGGSALILGLPFGLQDSSIYLHSPVDTTLFYTLF